MTAFASWIARGRTALVAASAVLVTTLPLPTPTGAGAEPVCRTDADCKLVYDSCDCEAVPASSSGRAPSSTKVCVVNRCTLEGTEAACHDGGCVKRTPLRSAGTCRTDGDCKLLYSSCSCEAVPASDPRDLLPSEVDCAANRCRVEHTRAVCSGSACSTQTTPDDSPTGR